MTAALGAGLVSPPAAPSAPAGGPAADDGAAFAGLLRGAVTAQRDPAAGDDRDRPTEPDDATSPAAELPVTAPVLAPPAWFLLALQATPATVPADPGSPATGITGLPAGALPATALPTTALPTTALPTTGLPITGLPATGVSGPDPAAGPSPAAATAPTAAGPAADATPGTPAPAPGPAGADPVQALVAELLAGARSADRGPAGTAEAPVAGTVPATGPLALGAPTTPADPTTDAAPGPGGTAATGTVPAGPDRPADGDPATGPGPDRGATPAPAPPTPGDAPVAPADVQTGPEPAPADPTQVPAAVPAPAPPTSAAAVSPAPVPAPADPPVAAQLTPQLTALTGADGTHSVTVVLAPESLGEVRVQLTVTGDQVAMTLAAGQESGRAALAEALPELRRDLAAAGLSLTDAQVTTGSGGQQTGQQTGQGWSQGTDPRTAPITRWGQVPTGPATADEDRDTTSTTRHTRGGATSTGVDVRV